MTMSPQSPAGAFQIGSPVWVRRHQGPYPRAQGIVAYLGPVHFADGNDWVGVRLTGHSVGQGKNNGTVEGKTYFQSLQPQSGLFVRKSCVSLRNSSNAAVTPTRKEAGTASPGSPPTGTPLAKQQHQPYKRHAKRSRINNHEPEAMVTPLTSRTRISPHKEAAASPRFFYEDAEQQERYEALQRWKLAKKEGRPLPSPPNHFSGPAPLIGWVIEFRTDGSSDCMESEHSPSRASPRIQKHHKDHFDGSSTIASFDSRIQQDFDRHEQEEMALTEPTMRQGNNNENVPPPSLLSKKRRRQPSSTGQLPNPQKAQWLRQRLRALEQWREEQQQQHGSRDEANGAMEPLSSGIAA